MYYLLSYVTIIKHLKISKMVTMLMPDSANNNCYLLHLIPVYNIIA